MIRQAKRRYTIHEPPPHSNTAARRTPAPVTQIPICADVLARSQQPWHCIVARMSLRHEVIVMSMPVALLAFLLSALFVFPASAQTLPPGLKMHRQQVG